MNFILRNIIKHICCILYSLFCRAMSILVIHKTNKQVATYNIKGTCFFIFIFSFSLFAQDPHYSNWQMSPLNQNPANTGMFEGDFRFIFNYRNQWQRVKVPYNTFSFGTDFNCNKTLIKGTKEAVGLMFNHDVAGDGRYTITEFKIPFNHKITFKKDTSLTLGIGVLAGLTNLKIDQNKLSYDMQWDGDIYNSGLSNGENFIRQSKLITDFSFGVVIQKKFKKHLSAIIGYGLNHINQPNISFYDTKDVTLKMRHSENLQLKYNVNQISAVMFEYYGNQQQAFKENLLGLSYYYTIDSKTNTILNAGLFMRTGDALITTIGLEQRNIRLQVSYDYNYSQFKRATNGRGGFEISLIYIHAKQKVFVPKSRVCPIYM